MKLLLLILFLSIAGCAHRGTIYSIPIELQPGENIITVEATDRAGNVSMETFTIIRE